MEVGNIVTGHFNELFGLNKDISQERLKICRRCPLYSDKFGGLCNNKLYIDPNTGKVSKKEIDMLEAVDVDCRQKHLYYKRNAQRENGNKFNVIWNKQELI